MSNGDIKDVILKAMNVFGTKSREQVFTGFY